LTIIKRFEKFFLNMERKDYIGIIKYLSLKGLTAVEIQKELESALGIFDLSLTIIKEIVNAQNFLEFNKMEEEMTDIEMNDRQLTFQKIKKKIIIDKDDYYGIIKYFFFKGLKTYEILNELEITLKGLYYIPSIMEIQEVTYNWEHYVRVFKLYRRVTNIVMNDCRLTLEEIGKMTKLLPVHVSYYLKKTGWMQKYEHWVPRVLTSDQKHIRVQVSKECLKYFMNQEDFLHRFVSFYEISFYYTPKAEQYTSNSFSPKKVSSSKKVTAIIFWNSTGIILINYIENESAETISKNYVDMFEYLKKATDMQPQMVNKTLLFQQEHPIYISRDAQKILELQHEFLLHPPHSPDLVAHNFHLLPNLKKWLANKKFTSCEEVKTMVNSYFMSVPKCEYESSILRLKYRWHYCIHLKGDYL